VLVAFEKGQGRLKLKPSVSIWREN